MVTDGNWSKEDIAALTKAIVRFPPGTNARWKTIADFIDKPQKEVIKKAQELAKRREQELQEKQQAEERKKQQAMQRQATATQKKAAPQSAQAKAKAKPGAATDAAAAAAAQPQVDAEGWTNAQQAQMEAAMKQFPGSMPTKERWIAIADLVEGKTAKECFTRYKNIVAKLKAEQAKK